MNRIVLIKHRETINTHAISSAVIVLEGIGATFNEMWDKQLLSSRSCRNRVGNVFAIFQIAIEWHWYLLVLLYSNLLDSVHIHFFHLFQEFYEEFNIIVSILHGNRLRLRVLSFIINIWVEESKSRALWFCFTSITHLIADMIVLINQES